MEATNVLIVDDSIENLLRTWTDVTHTLVSIGYASYLYQTLESASIIHGPAHDDLVLRKFLKDLTITVNPRILSKYQCPFSSQSSSSLQGSLAPASHVVNGAGDGVLSHRDRIKDVPWSAEFTTNDGHLLCIPGLTSPGERCDILNHDVQDMLAISGDSYFDLHESSHVLMEPPPISTNLHEQSTPGNYNGSYVVGHNTQFVSDTGPPRPTVVTKSSQKIVKHTKNQRIRVGRKRTTGSSAKPRRSDVQVLESVNGIADPEADPDFGNPGETTPLAWGVPGGPVPGNGERTEK